MGAGRCMCLPSLPIEIIGLVKKPNSNYNNIAMFPVTETSHIPGFGDDNVFPDNTNNDDEGLGGSQDGSDYGRSHNRNSRAFEDPNMGCNEAKLEWKAYRKATIPGLHDKPTSGLLSFGALRWTVSEIRSKSRQHCLYG